MTEFIDINRHRSETVCMLTQRTVTEAAGAFAANEANL